MYDNPFEELGKPELLLHMAWRNGFVHNDPSHIEDLPKHFEFIKKYKRRHSNASGKFIWYIKGCAKKFDEVSL